MQALNQIKALDFWKRISLLFKGLTMFLIFLSSIFVLIIKYYVISSNNLMLNNFITQNKLEIASADSVSLSSRLNSLSAIPEITCLKASKFGVIFFRYTIDDCESDFLASTNKSQISESGIVIEITTHLTKSLTLILFGLYFLILITLVILTYLYYAYTKIKFENQKLMIEVSAQVAHDIRSPLSALNMVSNNLNEVSEEKRQLLKNAIQRINDIANDLLNLEKEKNSNQINLIKEKNSLENIMVYSFLDALMSEKRTQYRSNSNLIFEQDLSQTYGLFIKINRTELSRAISNLINNAVEAINSGEKGIVQLNVVYSEKSVSIQIIDNGRGIPNEILENLGQRGITSGKKSKNSGSGLGVYQSKKAVEESGGKFIVDSQSAVNSGTKISLVFPESNRPDWFLNSIDIYNKLIIVSVDDDKSIHDIWRKRFYNILELNKNIELKEFTSPSDFIIWYNRLEDQSLVKVLIDYEFKGFSETGMHIIQRMDIVDKSILVTSRCNDEDIIKISLSINLRILPKELIEYVPIRID